MTGGALGARHPLHGPGALMFLVTDRTGTILHDVWFVKCVGPFVFLEMAGLAIFVDRIKGDAMAKSIAQHFLEFDRGQVAANEELFVVTAGAFADQRRVIGRKFSRVKKSFVPSYVINND